MTAGRFVSLLLAAWLSFCFVFELNAFIKRTNARVEKVRAIGEANTIQAQSKWIACLRNQHFTVGTEIYRCYAVKSELTTDLI